MSQAGEPPAQRIERLERELRLARTELDDFTRAVSHDLRAPLRHMGAYTQILREDLSGAQRELALPHLDRISEAAVLMGRQIDGLMRLARVGQAPMQPVPVDVAALARAVYTELRREPGPDAADGPGARPIDWQVAPGIPPLPADVILLREALTQLLANALKFTRPRPQASIRLHYQEEGSQCALTLADTGVGFNPAYQARLFQPFSRLHSGAAFDGLGLGLAITRKIIERHGGRIEASSEPDGGCRVSIRLPLG